MTDPDQTGLRDQMRAATAEAAKTFAAAHAAHPESRAAPPATEPPDWIRPFITLHNKLVEGRHPQCIHLPPGPAVIHIAVWAPGFVCCTACATAGLLSARVPDGEEYRCDRCGHDFPDEGLRTGWLRGGHAIIHFAVCAACDPTATDDHAPSEVTGQYGSPESPGQDT